MKTFFFVRRELKKKSGGTGTLRLIVYLHIVYIYIIHSYKVIQKRKVVCKDNDNIRQGLTHYMDRLHEKFVAKEKDILAPLDKMCGHVHIMCMSV